MFILALAAWSIKPVQTPNLLPTRGNLGGIIRTFIKMFLYITRLKRKLGDYSVEEIKNLKQSSQHMN